MAARLIDVHVSEQITEPSSRLAGVQGEGYVTSVRLSFDGTWLGYEKTVVWYNAFGEVPVTQILGVANQILPTDPGWDPAVSANAPEVQGGVYLILIPPSALVYPNRCFLTINGVITGATSGHGVARSINTEFEVRPSLLSGEWPPGGDIGNSLYDQIMEILNRLLGYEEAARQWALLAESYAHDSTGLRPGVEATDNAKYYMEQAQQYAQQAGGGANLPLGGTTGQALVKNSNADGDVKWDTVAGGSTTITEEIITENLYADNGAISNLVVNHMRTDYNKPWRYIAGESASSVLQAWGHMDIDYLEIRDEQIDYISAVYDSLLPPVQYTTYEVYNPKPVYWLNGVVGTVISHAPLVTTGEMTLDPTLAIPVGGTNPEPVMVYQYSEATKRRDRFELVTYQQGTQDVVTKMPVTIWGAGNGAPGFAGSTKARVYKTPKEFVMEYFPEADPSAKYFIKISESGIETNPPLTSGSNNGVYIRDSVPTNADLAQYPSTAVVFVRGAAI